MSDQPKGVAARGGAKPGVPTVCPSSTLLTSGRDAVDLALSAPDARNSNRGMGNARRGGSRVLPLARRRVETRRTQTQDLELRKRPLPDAVSDNARSWRSRETNSNQSQASR